MNEKDFLEWCKKEVAEYTNKHLDKSDNKKITSDSEKNQRDGLLRPLLLILRTILSQD